MQLTVPSTLKMEVASASEISVRRHGVTFQNIVLFTKVTAVTNVQLCESQWLLNYCLLFPSCFLYNPKFRQALFPTCFRAGFLLVHSPKWRRPFSSKSRLTFNRLHGVISQKIDLFREIFCSCRKSNSNSTVIPPTA
jgi:hypothetical protein